MENQSVMNILRILKINKKKRTLLFKEHKDTYIIIFVRLFKMKKRFRDVFGTFVILLPRLNSAVIVLGEFFWGSKGSLTIILSVRQPDMTVRLGCSPPAS